MTELEKNQLIAEIKPLSEILALTNIVEIQRQYIIINQLIDEDQKLYVQQLKSIKDFEDTITKEINGRNEVFKHLLNIEQQQKIEQQAAKEAEIKLLNTEIKFELNDENVVVAMGENIDFPNYYCLYKDLPVEFSIETQQEYNIAITKESEENLLGIIKITKK